MHALGCVEITRPIEKVILKLKKMSTISRLR